MSTRGMQVRDDRYHRAEPDQLLPAPVPGRAAGSQPSGIVGRIGGVVQRKALASAMRQAPPGAGGEPYGGAASHGDGAPHALPAELCASMSRAFGADFSAVRIHEGDSAAALGAKAYTRGTDLHFAPGEYQPYSQAGRELIGHELAHVVQQSKGRVGATAQAKGGAVNEDAGLEREADELGARAARGERVTDAAPDAAPAAVHADGVATQFMRAVRGVVPGEAVVRAHKSGQWMVVQGLDVIGCSGWHLSIFPLGQSSWTGAYKLPASGVRGLTDWMMFDEFHLTSPDGVHFFYADNGEPQEGSNSSGGKSPKWGNKQAWTAANTVCAKYFAGFGLTFEWLQQQIAAKIEAVRDGKLEDAHQELMFKLYMNARRQQSEYFEHTQLSFEDWVKQLEAGFRGSHAEFREHVRKEHEARGGALPVYEKRQWRVDEGGFGYVDNAKQ